MELDIFIPSISVGIEYDGRAFHSSEESYLNDKHKYEKCKVKGIFLIRIREFNSYNEKEICDLSLHIRYRPTNDALSYLIIALLESIGKTIKNVNVANDATSIKSMYLTSLLEESIASVHPDLAAEWHPTKNGVLKPEMFSRASGEKVWWQCKNGHEWKAEIKSRYRGNNCPYCSGKKLLIGYNDLATVNPLLAAEWHPTKNDELTPSAVQSYSGKKVWWKCNRGHEWQAIVAHRTNGSGCPYCFGRFAIMEENDLITVYPQIAQLWCLLRNGDLLPSNVSPGSEKIVWWKGQCGHEWQRSVKTMVKTATCPYCSGRRVLQGFNDLSTTMPDLAREWDFNLNDGKMPTMFSKGSGVKVWWNCAKGHKWQARIADRVAGHGCPECAKKKEGE